MKMKKARGRKLVKGNDKHTSLDRIINVNKHNSKKLIVGWNTNTRLKLIGDCNQHEYTN